MFKLSQVVSDPGLVETWSPIMGCKWKSMLLLGSDSLQMLPCGLRMVWNSFGLAHYWNMPYPLGIIMLNIAYDAKMFGLWFKCDVGLASPSDGLPSWDVEFSNG